MGVCTDNEQRQGGDDGSAQAEHCIHIDAVVI